MASTFYKTVKLSKAAAGVQISYGILKRIIVRPASVNLPGRFSKVENILPLPKMDLFKPTKKFFFGLRIDPLITKTYKNKNIPKGPTVPRKPLSPRDMPAKNIPNRPLVIRKPSMGKKTSSLTKKIPIKMSPVKKHNISSKITKKITKKDPPQPGKCPVDCPIRVYDDDKKSSNKYTGFEFNTNPFYDYELLKIIEKPQDAKLPILEISSLREYVSPKDVNKKNNNNNEEKGPFFPRPEKTP